MSNTIHCGDALEVLRTMPDKSVDLVLTDPPYGMEYQSAWRTATPKFERIANDDEVTWFKEIAIELYRVLKDDRHAYIFCNDYAISSFRDELDIVGFANKRTLVWVKNNHTSGDLEGDYGNKTEFILYAHKGRRALNGKRDTNVLECDRVSVLVHPTQKPVPLLSYLISKSTNPGDIVCDPYCGSGSTLEAAARLGRRYIGIDIEPKWAEYSRNRMAQGGLFS